MGYHQRRLPSDMNMGYNDDSCEAGLFGHQSYPMQLSTSHMSQSSTAPSNISSQYSANHDTPITPTSTGSFSMSPGGATRSPLGYHLSPDFSQNFVTGVSMQQIETNPCLAQLSDDSSFFQSGTYDPSQQPWDPSSARATYNPSIGSPMGAQSTLHYPAEIACMREAVGDPSFNASPPLQSPIGQGSPGFDPVASPDKYEKYKRFIFQTASKQTAWACGICANPSTSGQHRGCKEFKRRTDALRHVKTRHFPEDNRIECEVEGCERKGIRSFTRKDHYNEHLRETHKIPIPKSHKGARKC